MLQHSAFYIRLPSQYNTFFLMTVFLEELNIEIKSFCIYPRITSRLLSQYFSQDPIALHTT